MNQVPILFLGDSPDCDSGLARILRDLACRLVSSPKFRVGTLGRGGNGSRHLPFPQYNFDERMQWGEYVIEKVWEDFAGDEIGIVMTIWDPSRLTWFALPQYLPDQRLREFLMSGRFQRWGYFPIDAEGPGHRLTLQSSEVVRAYHRPLAYTQFGKMVLQNSIGSDPVVDCIQWIPHGFDADTWTPKPREGGRLKMGFHITRDIVIGMVMTNQARKNWGLAFQIMAALKREIPRVKFWCHIDTEERYWDIRALRADFGVDPLVTTVLTDDELALMYSACDLTILPSLGEGFGYPIVESLACGVPVLHGKYAGGCELIPDERCLVPVSMWRLDTLHNCVRPVFKVEDWVSRILINLEDPMPPEKCRESVIHLAWESLWRSTWLKWFEKGVDEWS